MISMEASPSLGSSTTTRARTALLASGSTLSDSHRRVVFLASQAGSAQTLAGSTHETRTWPHHWSPNQVILIFGIYGALRREEFTNILVSDVKKLDKEDVLLVSITKTKNYVPRSFTIAGPLYEICWEYMLARPRDCQINRFFIRYYKGRCYNQPIGINKFATVPKDVATYLNLPDANSYTGHSFRRTSATLLVDAGADLTTLKRHGGWKSSTVASGYIADSINNKKRIGNQIGSDISYNKRAKVCHIVPDSSPEDLDFNSIPAESTSLDATEESAISTPVDKNIQHNDLTNIPSTSRGIDVSTNEVNKNSTCERRTTNTTSVKEQSIDNTKSICKPNTVNTSPEQHLYSVNYHPDLGLYVQDLFRTSQPNFIFQNCTVSIKVVDKNAIMGAIIENKATQTD